MADAFDEVEQELRDDRYRAMAMRYGPIALAALAAVLLGVGGQEFWSWRTTDQARTASDQFDAGLVALENDQVGTAREIFEELSANGQRGYRFLSLIEEAEVALEAGDETRAGTLYEQASEQSRDALFGDLAALRSIMLRADELDGIELRAALEPLAHDEAPYRHIARELMAASAWESGDIERAQRLYRVLSLAPDSPQGVRGRAGQALALIDVERAAEEAAAEPEQTETDVAEDGEEPTDDGVEEEEEG